MKLFEKYRYTKGDTILIVKAPDEIKNQPILYRVSVVNRTWAGYVVSDSEDNKYIIPYRYVIARE